MAKNKKQKTQIPHSAPSAHPAPAKTAVRRRLSPQDMISRYGYWAILILVLLMPYAVPAIYDALAVKMSWSRFYYLDSPVDNQWFALQFGIIIILLIECTVEPYNIIF